MKTFELNQATRTLDDLHRRLCQWGEASHKTMLAMRAILEQMKWETEQQRLRQRSG